MGPGGGAGGGRVEARPSIAHVLRRLILFAALPLVGVVFLLASLAYQDGRRSAEASVQRFAVLVAGAVQRVVEETHRGLDSLARSPGIVAMRRGPCREALREVLHLQPRYANVFLLDRQGDPVCGALEPRGGAAMPNLADREWFRAVLGGEPRALGTATRGPLTGLWVAPVAVPVRAAGGEIAGVLVGALSLSDWTPPGGASVLPLQTALGVVDEAGTVILRYPDAAQWVGRDLGDAALFTRLVERHAGPFDLETPQGNTRIWSARDVPGTRWVAFAGVSRQAVVGPMVEKIAVALALCGVALAIAIGMAWMAGQELSRPVAEIARVVRGRTAGGDELVPVRGPAEIAEVADELNRMIRARHASEQRLQVLSRALEQSPASVVITDAQGRIEYVNPRFEEVSGYAREEVIGRNPRILKSGTTPLDTYRDLWTTVKGGGTWRGRLCNRRKDGTLFWEQAAISGLLDDPGHVTHYVAVKHDVTEHVHAEQRLIESERRFTTVFQLSPTGIAVSRRADGTFLAANDSALRIFGRPREEVVGNTALALGLYRSPEHREETLQRLEGDAQGGRFQFEVSRPDGSAVSLEVAMRQVELQSEPCIVSIMVDVTERRRLEEVRLRSQKLESLGTLAGGIAHDFNNILSAIRGNAELAADDVGPGHPAMASLAEIRKAGRRASELVRRITTFGRPKEARQEAILLQNVVREVLELLRSTLPASIELVRRIAADAPPVMADSTQVHEAVVNLTTNAAYAIGARSGQIEYGVEAVRVEGGHAARLDLPPGRYVRLVVRDNGCGMDTATASRIFDAFFTTKPVGDGTGLGLSMVYGIMQAHGGTVTVDTSPGRGAAFSLYFPALEALAPPATERVGGDAAPAVASGCRLLYVDDEESLVLLARRALTRLGHQVTAFTRPAEAIAALAVDPEAFDVLVTDLSMPGMSGFDVAREALALRPDLAVVMMTGYLRPGDEDAARAAGIRRVVVKASTVQDLARALDGVLRSEIEA